MSDAYVECLVKAKGSVIFKILRVLLYFLAGVGFVSMMLGTGVIGVILGLALGAGGYYVGMLGEVEYEYLYMDKELSVDKILAQSKRKRVATYAMERMEIMAPVKSYRLDNYKNRQTKNVDYSIGYEDQPDKRYVFYYEGGEKVLISPSEDMIKVMKNANPRKVFSD
ncbi:MAG: hypothetical protein J5721_01990 [Lachnospiraceae bacterium]|nr:hypothetical protein [Lachnospiraceae bacterium]